MIVASKGPISFFEKGTNVCKRPFLRDFTFVNRLLEKMGKYKGEKREKNMDIFRNGEEVMFHIYLY